jgi:hypothetical protein
MDTQSVNLWNTKSSKSSTCDSQHWRVVGVVHSKTLTFFVSFWQPTGWCPVHTGWGYHVFVLICTIDVYILCASYIYIVIYLFIYLFICVFTWIRTFTYMYYAYLYVVFTCIYIWHVHVLNNVIDSGSLDTLLHIFMPIKYVESLRSVYIHIHSIGV